MSVLAFPVVHQTPYPTGSQARIENAGIGMNLVGSSSVLDPPLPATRLALRVQKFDSLFAKIT